MNSNPRDLYSSLARVASQEPENTAFMTGDKRTTYHELLYFTDRAADMFWELGVRKGDRVAIVLRNSVEFVITYYALAKLGAVAVPINFMVSKEEELFFILENSRARGVVTEKEFVKNYQKVRPRLPELKFVLSSDFTGLEDVGDFWRRLRKAHYHPQTQKPWAEEHDTVSILYTSGTTGNPKGVLLSHHNQLENARAAAEGLRPVGKDVFMCLLPMFHTFAWTGNVVVPLLIGAKTLIVKNLTPPKPWLQAMGREGVTIMIAVPQIYGVLAKEARGLKKFFLKYWAFRRVRFCLSGAAPLTHSVKDLFESAFSIPILEGYGLTETSPVVSINLPDSRRHGSVGRPIPGVKVRIIDEHGRELARGEEGEICVHGPNVTRGYHANEDATRALFTGDGWLRTGDIGVVDQDGFIFIRDRKKDMIIVKGLKVVPAQVEQVICHHPKVQEAAVIGVPDEFGNETIKCFCVPRPGEKLEKQELLQYMKAHLDAYKRPRDVEFTDALPKNSLQKVLKRELIRKELEKRLRTRLA